MNDGSVKVPYHLPWSQRGPLTCFLSVGKFRCPLPEKAGAVNPGGAYAGSGYAPPGYCGGRKRCAARDESASLREEEGLTGACPVECPGGAGVPPPSSARVRGLRSTVAWLRFSA